MKILCFGDSNTYGYDPRSFFGGRYAPEQRWVDLLAAKLNCEVVNAGENGRAIPGREEELFLFNQMLERGKPLDILIIMLGTNDLLQGNPVETVVKRMEFFLEHISFEKSKILLIGPPPLKPGEWVKTQMLIDQSIELNREYDSLARRSGLLFADAREWDISLTFDGVHFTEEGHRNFSIGLYNYLNKKENDDAGSWNESAGVYTA